MPATEAIAWYGETLNSDGYRVKIYMNHLGHTYQKTQRQNKPFLVVSSQTQTGHDYLVLNLERHLDGKRACLGNHWECTQDASDQNQKNQKDR